jgi:hypothetical protein
MSIISMGLDGKLKLGQTYRLTDRSPETIVS